MVLLPPRSACRSTRKLLFVITLILNFTDCPLWWVTHLSLVEQEVVWNVCETQRAAPSPLLSVPQWVGAALVSFQLHLHRTWQNPQKPSSFSSASPSQVSSALCWKLSKSRLCCHGDKGNYLQKINKISRADSWQKFILMSSFQSQPVFQWWQQFESKQQLGSLKQNSCSYMKFRFTEKFLEKM